MNVKIAVICAALALAFSCGANDTSAPKKSDPMTMSLHSDDRLLESSALSAAKLREYCRACHAVGSLRFIYDDSDQNIWTYIHTNNVPGKSERWSDAIVRVLSWPADAAPPPTPIMDPPGGRDWMPKGSKRLHFAAEKVEGLSLRQYIINAINQSPLE
jgi:hypothetical protein